MPAFKAALNSAIDTIDQNHQTNNGREVHFKLESSAPSDGFYSLFDLSNSLSWPNFNIAVTLANGTTYADGIITPGTTDT